MVWLNYILLFKVYVILVFCVSVWLGWFLVIIERIMFYYERLFWYMEMMINIEICVV